MSNGLRLYLNLRLKNIFLILYSLGIHLISAVWKCYRKWIAISTLNFMNSLTRDTISICIIILHNILYIPTPLTICIAAIIKANYASPIEFMPSLVYIPNTLQKWSLLMTTKTTLHTLNPWSISIKFQPYMRSHPMLSSTSMR